ncbi:MAG: ribonuclease H-like domain-containing protein [Clostridia bacterium]|jgi:uncharacterized protein YprB with RNaseH-like and TPR domain
MIPNLKSKLRNLSSSSIAVSSRRDADSQTQSCISASDILSLKCYEKHISFSSSFVWGYKTINSLLDETTRNLGAICQLLSINKPHLNRILFIDTETTGLSGGTGTVAFLVGIGYFRNDQFHIHQLFMRDYSEEFFLLQKLGEIFREYELLISFNGKSFDIPLLDSRFIMHRLREYQKDFSHMDLLHLSRRIWKLRLDSCSLKSLEHHILHVERAKDIPSAEIPGRYFSFLESGDMALIEDVLIHNQYDILSLVFLLGEIVHYYTNPMSGKYSQDLYSLGRIYEKAGQTGRAIECYQKADELGMGGRAKSSLSLLYKKNRSFKKAAQIWREMIEAGQGGTMPYFELAKYLEHHVRDFNGALEHTCKAIEYIRRMGIPWSDSGELSELYKRRNRLIKKLNRLNENKKILMF